jgi:transcriptional regulator with XRE-family HTH domain
MARLKRRKEFCDEETLKRISLRREELHISQRQLAEMLGYSTRTYISRVELGSLPLAKERLPKWADALKTSVAYLLHEQEDAASVTVSSDPLLDMLISNYDQMNADEKKMLFDFSNLILKRYAK